jgi:hypothetical protein
MLHGRVNFVSDGGSCFDRTIFSLGEWLDVVSR